MSESRIRQAADLMNRFAARGRRYLWTDAFAVTNYLGLAIETRERRFIDRALALIGAVHATLGRQRPDAAHPTAGGLRIGKPLPERSPGEPLDERLEWDRDGQYFHYLTKWMHALDQTTRVTGDLRCTCWARELAQTAHRAFVYTARDGSRRMYWKMSIDLTRPLVPSMGQHDPLDGYVTYLQLHDTSVPAESCEVSAETLDAGIADFATMIDLDRLPTDDPLGIGGLLVDAHRLAQLDRQDEILEACLAGALTGMRHARGDPQGPAEQRLAFRELGLAIGLAAVEHLAVLGKPPPAPLIAELRRVIPLRATLEKFWLDPSHQRAASWQEHIDINTVMLATSLVPDGFLILDRHPSGVPFLNFHDPAFPATFTGR